MAKVFDHITKELQEFIADQHLFFVASAPLSADGHVNMSPKGLDCFRILSPHQVAYLDLTGSGNETSAHLQENGRITLMFCAFAEPPLILRLYGKGQTILPNSPDWDSLYSLFPQFPGVRQIIIADIERVQTSCGFGVPLYEYQGQRRTLIDWANKKGEQGIKDYQQQKNVVSIDGLSTPLRELDKENLHLGKV
ncbi:Pyridoxamine 5'-phosphate oxidase-related, FMN-binding [Nostoc sp. NIES-3756]|uniref:pyridoxamine 5'-phosphate oxidase family protein n=1 Tax=Nostoc sp. NIES-3756 TaxID=1751286 RepID=UPI00071F933B|nr:pyridoxamine 5'-phosphate oxidase family protein [Nostoc sp. NIES-3756]BAT54513.1 Pyridoxamine 5'-phosphate oxidase-related, FMN-binding [Nostoc sp. NIES-3756]